MPVTMSDKELNRINVIQSVVEKRMRRRDAAHQLALTERQTQRLMNRFRESGAAGLVNLRRGRPGNHRLPESLKLRVLSLLHDNYSDFGPTLAAEKLPVVRFRAKCWRNWGLQEGFHAECWRLICRFYPTCHLKRFSGSSRIMRRAPRHSGTPCVTVHLRWSGPQIRLKSACFSSDFRNVLRMKDWKICGINCAAGNGVACRMLRYCLHRLCWDISARQQSHRWLPVQSAYCRLPLAPDVTIRM